MRALLWYFFVCLFLFHLKIWFDLNYKCGHLVHYHFSHGVHRYAVPLRGVGHGLPSPGTRSIECAEPPGAQRRSQSSPSSWAGGAVQSYPWCFFFCFLIKPIPLYPLSKVDCDKTWGDFFFHLTVSQICSVTAWWEFSQRFLVRGWLLTMTSSCGIMRTGECFWLGLW